MSRFARQAPDRDPDAVAAQRCRDGDLEAFEPLVRRHSQRVIRLAYHFLGDWDEARDLAQETFTRAFLNLGRYESDRPFVAWLCTIAARLATDRLRSRARRRTAGSSPCDRAPIDPDAALGLKEALDRLTPRQRQAVVLCDLHGFTAPEAAEMIGCSPSTVRVLRFLARSRLRSLLVPDAGLAAAPDGAATQRGD